MKGQAQKLETLSDGSVKLSVYFQREQLKEVAEFSCETVDVRLAGQEPAEDTEETRNVILMSIRNAALRLVELADNELRKEM